MMNETPSRTDAKDLTTTSGGTCSYSLRFRDGRVEALDRHRRLEAAQLEAIHSGRADLIGISADGTTVLVWTESDEASA